MPEIVSPCRSYRGRPALMLALLITVLALVLVGAASPLALLTVIEQGAVVAFVLLGAVGLGSWPAFWLAGGGRPGLQQFCLAAGLGLGLLGVLTLAFGVSGLLGFASAAALVGGGCVAGLLGLQSGIWSSRPAGPTNLRSSAALLLLPLVPALAGAIFAATLPPRILWIEEAFGYDVLEYHLQAPREYYEAGRVHFLPHNVYASFPQQMEMLYLLVMHLSGGALAGAIPSQLLHLATGVLAAVALAAWTAPGWPRIVVVLAAGTTPWLGYLGALAYVELGVLLFGAISAGLLLETVRADRTDLRGLFAAGLFAGFAGGCKYTALVLVACAAGLAWVATRPGFTRVTRGARAGRPGPAEVLRGATVFFAGVLIAFAPWMLRNAAFTGNPVYPFAYRIFGGAAWSPAQDAQWRAGHALQDAAPGAGTPARVLLDEVLVARRFGPVLFALAGIGVLAGLLRGAGETRAAALFLTTWAAGLLAAWMLLTHMPGRFAVPVVIPAALLSGIAVQVAAGRGTHLRRVLVAGGVAGALLNVHTMYALLRDHQRHWQRFDVDLRALPGATTGLAGVEPLNRLALPPGANVKLIGEARAFYLAPRVEYTVVFNRDPWLEYAAGATPADAVAWLRTHGVTHVVFSWPEIERLGRSYGFPAIVTPTWVSELERSGLRPAALPDEAAGSGLALYAVPAEGPATRTVTGVETQ